MTIHLMSRDTERSMPEWVKADYQKDGYRGAACGYMRKNATDQYCLVTCKLCIRATNKRAQEDFG